MGMPLKTGLLTVLITTTLLSWASFINAQESIIAPECNITIDSTDTVRFDTDSIIVSSACDEFTVSLTHSGRLAGNVMGHNWVLSKMTDANAVANEGIVAGLEENYLKPGDKRVIAATEVIGGGESTSVTFDVDKLKKGGSYVFFCSFPGHTSLMKGTLELH